MILVLAEKPSVAKILVQMLTTKGERFEFKDGAWKSKKYTISNFFGHLYSAMLPSEMDPAKYDRIWGLDMLPIFPEKSRLKFKVKESARKQVSLLAKLVKDCTSIVNVTDPDAEGEGIFRIWYNENHLTLPVKRVWALSLELGDMQRQWEEMQDAKEYDNLADAQRCRQYSDWVVGMNGSVAYSVVASGRISVGRVQTPVLRMIVERDYKVKNYEESFSYRFLGRWHNLRFIYKDSDGQSKFETDKIPLNIINECMGIFHVEKFSAKDGKINPPITYALIDIQKSANKVFGYDLKTTLDIVQSLYETHKAVTYPRTDSGYLPESGLNRYHSVVRQISSVEEQKMLIPEDMKPHCVKDTQAAHTGIIPTGIDISKLTMSDKEKNVYELIRLQFVKAFMRSAKIKKFSILISNGTVSLSHESKTFIEKNWTLFDSGTVSDDDDTVSLIEEKSLLPKELDSSEVEKLKSTKPKYYDAASLVQAMVTAGKFIEDKDLAKVLANAEGIGTPATRQTIPEELVKRGFVTVEKKSYISTEKGRGFISVVDKKVSSPEMTAEWEKKLKEIEKGTLCPDAFIEEIEAYITSTLIHVPEEAKNIQQTRSSTTIGNCPCCKSDVVVRDKAFSCLNKECNFVIFRNLAGKCLTESQGKKLLTSGETGKIKGFTSKAGNKFDAIVTLTPENKTAFKFDNNKPDTKKK